MAEERWGIRWEQPADPGGNWEADEGWCLADGKNVFATSEADARDRALKLEATSYTKSRFWAVRL